MEFASCLNFSTKNDDLRCGVFVFGGFAAFGNMFLLFLMLVLGLKLLRLGFYQNGLVKVLDDCTGKSNDLRIGFCSGTDVCCICYPKISSCKTCLSILFSNPISDSKNINEELCEPLEEDLEEELEEGLEVGDDYEVEDEEEMDTPALRKAIRIERERANNAYLELEKERFSAATAANESLSMILKLQNELSSIKLEATQYRQLAEQKQLYDDQVIDHLRWIVLESESERRNLESQLNLCRQKLKVDLKAEEEGLEGVDWFGEDIEEGLISSLDMDSLPSVPETCVKD